MNNKEVAEYVENEGLGYAVQHGVRSDSFEDEELKKLWTDAERLLNAIENILPDIT